MSQRRIALGWARTSRMREWLCIGKYVYTEKCLMFKQSGLKHMDLYTLSLFTSPLWIPCHNSCKSTAAWKAGRGESRGDGSSQTQILNCPQAKSTLNNKCRCYPRLDGSNFTFRICSSRLSYGDVINSIDDQPLKAASICSWAQHSVSQRLLVWQVIYTN